MDTLGQAAPPAPTPPADFARVWERISPFVLRKATDTSVLPMPDWPGAFRILAAEFAGLDPDALATRIGDEWMSRVADALGEGWCVDESRNFLLLSTFEQGRAQRVLKFLEETFARLRRSLPMDVAGPLLGRCPVLAFDDHDAFIQYFAEFHAEDGEWSTPGGVYLNRGFGHIALPPLEPEAFMLQLERILAHELTHALLTSLQLPLWLDEAVAMSAEVEITRREVYPLDPEKIRQHRAFWDAEKIQEFWTGESWARPDEGNELSYSLARFIFRMLLDGGRTGREKVAELLVMAQREDAGFAAVEDVFGVHLDELLTDFLGPGEWRPRLPLFAESADESAEETAAA